MFFLIFKDLGWQDETICLLEKFYYISGVGTTGAPGASAPLKFWQGTPSRVSLLHHEESKQRGLSDSQCNDAKTH